MINLARTNPDFNDEAEASKVAAGYAALDRFAIHGAFMTMLQNRADAGETLRVLDVGAGSGDDAAAIARMGHEVVAAEPAAAIRAIGEQNTQGQKVQWLDATVGELAGKGLAPRSFDAALLSAVWQYLPKDERIDGLKTLANLMKPGAMLRFQYPSPPSRQGQYVISADQFADELAEANAQLPPAMQLNIEGAPIITKDSRDRTGIDGTPVYFLEFEVRSATRTQALAQTSSASATRAP